MCISTCVFVLPFNAFCYCYVFIKILYTYIINEKRTKGRSFHRYNSDIVMVYISKRIVYIQRAELSVFTYRSLRVLKSQYFRVYRRIFLFENRFIIRRSTTNRFVHNYSEREIKLRTLYITAYFRFRSACRRTPSPFFIRLRKTIVNRIHVNYWPVA